MSATHTYVLLELSFEAYSEIADKLQQAGYQHAFGPNAEIDMHGIAVTPPPMYQKDPLAHFGKPKIGASS